MRCPRCNSPIDLANESQPVCPACGEDPFSSESEFDLDDSEPLDNPAENAIQQNEPAPQKLGANEIAKLRAHYQHNRSGLYQEESLQDVCLECGCSVILQKGSRRECLNPRCRTPWYINHCGNKQCRTKGHRTPIDSRDAGTVQCPQCRWHKCPVCSSCEQYCPLSGKV